MVSDKETFVEFGPQFQVKILSSLLKDNIFIQTIHDILKSGYFEADANKFLCGTIIAHYMEWKRVPTLEVLKVKIKELDNDVLKETVISNLREVWRNLDSTDLDFIKSKTLDFCKNQKLKDAIVSSIDLLENKDYGGIKQIIDEALKAGSERDLGHDYNVGIEERLTKSTRSTISTPWDVINDVMDGGLGKGELGVIVAPAGIGKTWMLQSIASNICKKGLSVIHYTLELNQEYVGLRYDTIFSGTPTANIKFYKDEVRKIVESIEGKLLIKYFPTKSATVQTLSAHLKQIELSGIDIDLVIVDYADILSGIGTEKRHVLENIYEDLRGLAGEFEVPIWTASQANRSALEMEIIEADKVAEAYSKVMIADFVMSVSRKVEDKISHTARCHTIKNRFGVDGFTYPMNMNTNIGKIEIFESTTMKGKEQQNKMDNSEEYLRKQLSNKYKDLNKPLDPVEGFE
jgi:archaellum biogenesis ATPase FlaH